MPNLETTSTIKGEGALEYKGRKRLSKDDWMAISTDLMISVQAALGDRQPLDENLKDWNELYEMISDGNDWPWEGAADMFVPLIPTQLESLVAYIAGQVLVPHLVMVTGNTPGAAQSAHIVERYYNSETKRQRGDTTWFEELVQWLHAATRDGTAYVEALWRYRKTKLKATLSQDQMETDDVTGLQYPVLHPDTGLPMQVSIDYDVEDVYNDVDLRCVELRNVVMIPAASTTIEEAMAVMKIEYLYEDQLMEFVREGIMDKDEVEYVLSFVPVGETELVESQLPVETYSISGQIGLGGGQGTLSSRFYKNRGPVEIYRIHSRQFDLDGDGQVEENIFWLHSQSWRMIGWMRYPYFSGLRPFFGFSPFPRPKRAYGFSLVERLLGLQNETNSQRNQVLNYNDMALQAPLVTLKGAFREDEDMSWGLNKQWEADGVQDVSKAIARIEMPPLGMDQYQNEQITRRDAQEYTGLSNPQIGAPSSGKRSAAEARQWAAASGTRTGLIAMRFRMAIRPVYNFIHALKKQYLSTNQQFNSNGQQFQLTMEQLNQDYNIDITGAGDPIDAASRRNDTTGFGQMLMQLPLIQQNPMGMYYLIRKMMNAFDWDMDADRILGTEQDMVQRLQAAQQQQQQQQQQAEKTAGMAEGVKGESQQAGDSGQQPNTGS